MAHQNGRIYIDTSTTPNKGVEIADLQQVLGRGTGDLGLLCSDQEWYDTGALDDQGNPIYALRAVNRINPLAFWKPFRSSEKGFATTADQKAAIIAARCGFGIDQGGSLVYPTYTPNNGTSIPHAVWEYKKPRGKGGGDNGADEWYRINDFAPLGGTVGYYSQAVSPIYADFPASITSGSTVTPKTTITIRIDGSGDTERWRQNLCIAFADLFPPNSVYENYRFAVVFKNSRGTIVAVSPQSMANIRTNYYATVNVAYEDLETLLPTVGNTVEAAVCLIQNTNYSTTDTTILTNYTGTVVSLEISSGCDRTTLSYTGAGSIVGMSGTVTLTMGSKQTNTSIVGLSGYYPIEQIDVTLTAGPNWQNLTGVNLVLVLQCDGAMGTSSYPGGTQYLRFSLALTAGQTNRQYTAVYMRGVNGFDSAAWVPSSADAHLMIQFYAEQGDTTQALSAPQSPILLPR